jgi:geranylgeranyl reductase
MEKYDVIIVGGGPAGLKCAETLKSTNLKVLLLEKDPVFGDKLCAGGLTANDLKILDIPDEIIEHKISETSMCSPKRVSSTHAQAPFLYTVNRKQLGTWQRSLLDNVKNITVLTNARVTRIDDTGVTLMDATRYSYKHLVGADGHASLVRKYLKIPVEKKIIGIQYNIPRNPVTPRLEIHLDAKLFKAWYAWIFPHKDSIAVGCCSDPKVLPPKQLTQNFHKWLRKIGIDHSGLKLHTYPISYDHRGLRFKNGKVFLIGEAAGMACGLTGEGIYQSMVSGQEAANMILDPNHKSELMRKVLKYNSIQNRIMHLFLVSGTLRNILHELLLMAMNNARIKKFIRSSYSPSKR